MPFSDPIIGGGGDLIRDSIHSPLYVPSLNGWTVNKDGSAEFNSATFRGSLIVGVPPQKITIDNNGITIYDTSGNVAMVIGSAFNPTMTIGRNGKPQIQIQTATTGSGLIRFDLNDINNALSVGAITMQVVNDGLPNVKGILSIEAPGDSTCGIQMSGASADNTSGGSMVFMTGGVNVPAFAFQISGDDTLQLVSVGTDNTSGGQNIKFQVGTGAAGKYYAEEVDLGGNVVANNTLTTLIPQAVTHQNSDYGTAWNLVTGEWTCPESAYYDVTMNPIYLNWVSGSRIYHRFRDNTSANLVAQAEANPATTGAAGNVLAFTKWLTAGHKYLFQHLQATGVSRTTLSNPEASWGSISRHL